MMKKFLLFGMATLSLTCVEAAVPLMKTHSEDVLMKTGTTKSLIRNTSLSICRPGKAGVMKKIDEAAQPKGYVMYENFSGWDGKTKNWLPEGWEIDHRGESSLKDSWIAFEPNQYFPAVVDGTYCMCVGDAGKKQDEWLITPEITPKENMVLSYHMNINPFFFYDTKNLNYLTKEYEGGKITLFTNQVLIQEDGGEWKLLRDYAEEYLDYGYMELMYESTYTLEKQTVDLGEYAGKKIRIAFRYVGNDGDTMLLDAIGVGYPTLDDVWYMEPSNALYWGLSRDPYYSQTAVDIALYPANAPVKWPNMSGENANYTWTYSNNRATSSEEDPLELSVTYAPERPGATPTLYESPELSATADERIDALYKSPVQYFQIGGTTAFINSNNELQEHTAFQFPVNTLDLQYKGVRYDRLGVWSVPVYGYSEYANEYWLDYTLNGEEPMEGNYSHQIGLGNLFLPSYDSPLVVNGMSIYGWGRIWDDAELTATIYALDKDMHTDYDTYTVVARATLKGKDVLSMNDEGAKDYLYLPFHFDEPAVVQASDEHPAFLFMLEGFNSDKVDYFAAIQSYLPNETGYSAGYLLHEINIQGHVDMGTYRSLKSTRYMDNGKYIDHPCTFAIGLDAEYPWLTAETDEVEIKPEDETVSVKLNSYYDADRLKIEVPEGLQASITGRYDESVLTLTKTDKTKPSEGNVNITGPGVSLSLAVNDLTPNAVSSIETSKDIVAVYDMSGREISSTKAAGVYIVKYSDGKIRKVTVK